MKKILLCLMLLLSSLCFAEEIMRSAYYCPKTSKVSETKCKNHSHKDIKMYYLDKEYILSEYEKNSARVEHKFGGNKAVFLVTGFVKDLYKGFLTDNNMMTLEDGTIVSMLDKEDEDYYELNKGDEVYLLCTDLDKSLGNLTFDGMIISQDLFFEYDIELK